VGRASEANNGFANVNICSAAALRTRLSKTGCSVRKVQPAESDVIVVVDAATIVIVIVAVERKDCEQNCTRTQCATAVAFRLMPPNSPQACKHCSSCRSERASQRRYGYTRRCRRLEDRCSGMGLQGGKRQEVTDAGISIRFQ
jgi:hypothetical protein